MRQWGFLVAVYGLVMVTSACDVRVKGNEQPPASDEKGIPGPDITGTWRSQCVPDALSRTWKIIEVTFRNTSVSRRSRPYGDQNCTQLGNEKAENGTFRFVESHKDGTFTIEYKIPIGNGWSALPKEKVLLEAGVLYLSDYVIGDTVSKSSMISLERVAP